MDYKQKSVFQMLNEQDITPFLKEKNGMSYLPWSSAWTIVKTHYPQATYRVLKTEDDRLYHTDGRTCYVQTEVTIGDEVQVENLAIRDYKNKAIPLDNIVATDVDNSIKRCLTKNLALFGLGLSLWVGEELSEAAKRVKKEKEEENTSLSEKKKEIISKAKALISTGIKSEEIYRVITEIAGNRNPNTIKTMDIAMAVIEKLEETWG